MELAKLSASKLEALIEKREQLESVMCDKLIAAGRGYERISETMSKSDDLSLAYKAALLSAREARNEKSRRLEYHGSMKPVKLAVF